MQQEKKTRAFGPSQGAIRHIPNDLVLAEILFRLPAKSLGRFKLVSKSWNSFISTTKFHKLHLQRYDFTSSTDIFMQARHRNIFGETSKYFEFYTYKILHNNNHDDYNIEKIEFAKVIVSQKSIDAEDGEIEDKADYEVKSSNLIGTCNGLICFQLKATNRFCVWNPMTREQLRFKGPAGSKGRIYRSGFGYDSSTDQFKIVLMYGKAMTYLFTSGDRRWKQLDTTHTSQIERDLRDHRCLSLHSHGQYLEVLPILVGETLYWLVSKYGNQIMILTFDLKTSLLTFTTMSHPMSTGEPDRMFLCEIGQSLCVCLCGWTRLANNQVQVWKLEQNGKDPSSLKFLFTIKNAKSYSDRCDNMFELRDQSGRLLIPNLSELWDPIVLHPNKEHPHRREYDRIFEEKPIGFNWYCGFRYIESLISPHEFFMNPLQAKVCSKVMR